MVVQVGLAGLCVRQAFMVNAKVAAEAKWVSGGIFLGSNRIIAENGVVDWSIMNQFNSF